MIVVTVRAPARPEPSGAQAGLRVTPSMIVAVRVSDLATTSLSSLRPPAWAGPCQRLFPWRCRPGASWPRRALPRQAELGKKFLSPTATPSYRAASALTSGGGFAPTRTRKNSPSVGAVGGDGWIPRHVEVGGGRPSLAGWLVVAWVSDAEAARLHIRTNSRTVVMPMVLRIVIDTVTSGSAAKG